MVEWHTEEDGMSWTLGHFLICAPIWWLALGVAAAGTRNADIQLIDPANGTVVDTPLTATLRWSTLSAPCTYKVTLITAGGKPAAVFDGLKEGTCRVAVCPGRSYTWTVQAIDPRGKQLATSPKGSFRTPSPVLKEITDNHVLFAGMHPKARWVNVPDKDIVASDPSAVVSPWFYKKTYDGGQTPKLDQVRDMLPKPVWDGHEDEIRMYWYSWETLLSTWLYPAPKSDHIAVSNLIGMPTWAGWGSTMVWDTAFILQFARYGDNAYPFITGLDNCYARQHENGFICRESDNSNREVLSSWPVNPPLLPWAEWSYYKVTGDVERIRRVFLPLVKNYEWYMLYQRRSNGLYWTDGVNEADDSPRNALAHSWVSTTAVQAMAADILSKMAKLVGRDDLTSWFASESKSLKEMVNASFWDERNHVYNDLGVDGKPITVTEKGGVCKHGHMFWPLIAGIAGPERAEWMAKSAMDEKTFLRSSGIASLSADSAGYNKDTGSYWRGAVWPPIQYMVIKGLENCGNESAAAAISERYYDAFLTAYKAKGDICENMTPDRPEMMGVGKFVGWGGLAPIALLFEDIFGIRVDAPANRIDWHIRRLERHGIENLHFGKRTVSLICESRAKQTDACKLSTDSDGDFDLVVHLGSRAVTKHVKRGHTDMVVGGFGAALSCSSVPSPVSARASDESHFQPPAQG